MDRLMLGYTILPINLRFKGRILPSACPRTVDGLRAVMGGLDLRPVRADHYHLSRTSGGWLGMDVSVAVNPFDTVASDTTFTPAVAFGASARQSYERGAG